MRRETNDTRFREPRDLEIGLNLVSGSNAVRVRAGQATERRLKEQGTACRLPWDVMRQGEVKGSRVFASIPQLTE